MTYFLTRKAFSVIINICEHILLLWHKAVKYGVGRRKNVEKVIPHIRLCAYFLQFVFTPVMAYADSSVSVGTNMCFAIPGGLITGFVLVSMSRTKQKASKADKYIKSNLKLTGRNDTYLRTTTDKTKIKDD